MDSTQPKAADLTARPPLNDSLVHRDPPVKSDVQLNDARRKWPEDFRSTSGEVREYSVWKSARRRKDDIDTSGSNLHSEELPASIERAPSAPVYIGTLSIGPHQAEPEPVQMSAAAPRTPRRRDLEERHARLMDASPRLRQIFERRRELSRATDGTESTRAAQPVPQSPDSVSQSNAVIRHGMVPQGDGILPSEAARQVVPELPHSALKEVAHGFSGRWAGGLSAEDESGAAQIFLSGRTEHVLTDCAQVPAETIETKVAAAEANVGGLEEALRLRAEVGRLQEAQREMVEALGRLKACTQDYVYP